MSAQARLRAMQDASLVRHTGRIVQCCGLLLEAQGPHAAMGEVCDIHPGSSGVSVAAEVVGLREGRVLLMPHAELHGIGLGSEVIARGESLHVPMGPEFLGRVVDAFGQAVDGRAQPRAESWMSLRRKPINPLSRPPLDTALETGVRAIDSLLTLGRGQRLGLFAGAGVGKSTLLGMLVRQLKVDVIVLALIGERGREVREFIEQHLGPEGLARSVVVVSTADQPALVRCNAAWAATAAAEYFRDRGAQVALVMDSITRFAMAKREIGLAIGEPPTARGYTPSVFASLPMLLERCGTAAGGGSITALYTVLVEGDDMQADPVSDALSAILDGHFVLTRELAEQGHFPAIDVLKSVSRLMPVLASEADLKLARQTVALLHRLKRSRDLVDLGAYQAGSNAELDRALKIAPQLDAWLCQEINRPSSRAEGLQLLAGIMNAA
jgi:flagellum-specific ATP synthase